MGDSTGGAREDLEEDLRETGEDMFPDINVTIVT